MNGGQARQWRQQEQKESAKSHEKRRWCTSLQLGRTGTGRLSLRLWCDRRHRCAAPPAVLPWRRLNWTEHCCSDCSIQQQAGLRGSPSWRSQRWWLTPRVHRTECELARPALRPMTAPGAAQPGCRSLAVAVARQRVRWRGLSCCSSFPLRKEWTWFSFLYIYIYIYVTSSMKPKAGDGFNVLFQRSFRTPRYVTLRPPLFL
jgi:hypothetical protein